MVRYSVEEFGPFGGSAGIGHVARNQNRMERGFRMDYFQLREDLT
jgi:hypothetical protein